MKAPPPVLTIAGSDSSCGAGAQADLKAITALGGYALNALTSVVSETPGRVSKVCLLEPGIIADQMRVLFEGFPIAAAKTGMLGGKAQVEAVVENWRALAPPGLPLVADPVMVATGGGKLLEDDAIQAVRELLLPLAALVTPNMDEARVLWGRDVRTRADMERCARELADVLQTSVLVKGGHLEGGAAADVLCADGTITWHETERVPGVRTHGTGCTYSASIAACLALGLPLADAVARAKAYVAGAIGGFLSWQGARGEVHALHHFAGRLQDAS
ncbi:MAG TPA: bifunctional hydroxymethylpyrimidine kinase/phosphomethylpyrimidine kinase [Prosthecobacter sp.]|nr:bifunctional hydroxymethylpyrimidine kinase/phosphomethylpyrimidine kinase [Prosthecobacter sp.]HRK14010.1 bifunctional hydroxymethylpyrimidine kinase/phosphomethylpyrimidine kinase [Prosthecobacter sp.]